MRVLIADDEPIIRMDLREILEKHGYDVVAEASDGFDAVEYCKKKNPDLVILDVKMPLLDGITAARIITEENLSSTVVLLTAYGDKQFVESAKKANISGYFVKPVDERSLIPGLEIMIDRNLRIKRLEQEYRNVSKRLESRTVVEQAKGLLMSSRGFSEQEAFDHIRMISKSKNISMKRVAEIIMMRRGR